MIQDHPLEDILKLVQLAIEEEQIERLTPLFIADSIMRRLQGQEPKEFESYMKELTQPKKATSTRTSEQIENDFLKLIKQERDKHGINI